MENTSIYVCMSADFWENRFQELILKFLGVVDGYYREVMRLLRMEIQEISIPISRATRKQVFKNANGRCECCGRPLKMKQGDFHLTKFPISKLGPSMIQFLCPTDHRIYGHTCKEGRLQIQKVRKHKSPYWGKMHVKTRDPTLHRKEKRVES